MKILMLGWELPPYNFGGLGIACKNLASALTRQGLEIDFALPYLDKIPETLNKNPKTPNENSETLDKSPNNPEKNPESPQFSILSTTNLEPPLHLGQAYNSSFINQKIISSKSSKELYSIKDLQKLYLDYLKIYCEKNKPDVIHAHDWLTFQAGLYLKQNFNTPLITHVHSTEYDRSGFQGCNPEVYEIEKMCLEKADKIIAVSNVTKNILQEKYHLPQEKIHIIHNSIDENFSSNKNISNNLLYLQNFKNQGYTIISTIGRLTIQKGLPYFLKAAALALTKNPKLIFIIAGDGEEKESLIQLATELGIIKNVIFTGFIENQNLHDIYTISDVFVMSSISEPFGLTVLEAIHHDNALIITNECGVSEIVKSAFHYDFWDEEKLANEIIAISTSKSLKEKLIRDAKEKCQKFSWDDIAQKCIKLYNNLTKAQEK